MMTMIMAARTFKARITQSSFLSNFWFQNETLHQTIVTFCFLSQLAMLITTLYRRD